MNIMFVFDLPIIPYAGGVQRVTEVLATELINRGHNVIYLSYTNEDKNENVKFKCPQHYLDIYNQSEEEIRLELRQLLSHYNISHLICQRPDIEFIRYVDDNLPIVSVCHVRPFNSASLLAEQFYHVSNVNFKFGVFRLLVLCFPFIGSYYYTRIEIQNLRKVINLADKVCFLSRRFYPRLEKYLPGIDPNKLAFINNPNTFIVNDETDRCFDKENTILWVGRIDNYQKNVVGFLNVWDKISKRNPDWNALVIGDGNDLEYCKRYVLEKKIDRISFLGQQEDVSSFYKKAKFLAVTSYGEGWGMVIVEAMTYNCVPCAFDTYESLYDIIDNGINGLIVPHDVNEMVYCLQRYIDNDERWRSLAIAGPIKAKQFSVEHIVTQWETMLSNLSK